MNQFMAFSANRNDKKGLCIIRMMILFCLFLAKCAFEIGNGFYSSVFNGIICDFSGFYFFGITLSVLLSVYFYFFWIMFSVFFICQLASGFSFFSLETSFDEKKRTYFTMMMKPFFFFAAFVKFRQWFDFFTARTSFGYNVISHIRSFQRVWLGLFARPILVSSPFYYMSMIDIVKGK